MLDALREDKEKSDLKVVLVGAKVTWVEMEATVTRTQQA